MDSQVVGGLPSMTQVVSSSQLGSFEGIELAKFVGFEEDVNDG